MKISPLALLVTIVMGTVLNAFAQEAAVPGQSLGGIKLGSTRLQGISDVQKKLGKAKRQPSHTYAGGLVWDGWEVPKGDQFSMFEMLSVGGKIVQLRTWTSTGGTTPHNFAQLAKSQPLQKRVYLFSEPEGGGYNCFYYDNLKKGISYTGGTQDMFVLTSRPDGLIVHRPGVHPVAIESGLRGTTVTGANARAFKDLAAAQRVSSREIKAN